MSNILNDELERQRIKRQKDSDFFSFKDGQSADVTINGYQKAIGYERKDTIAFDIIVHDDEEGDMKKRFDCTNPYFLESVAELPKQGIGQRVIIRREGERKKTKYIVEPVIKRIEEEPEDPEGL